MPLPAMGQIHPALAAGLSERHSTLPAPAGLQLSNDPAAPYGELGKRFAAYGFLDAAAAAFDNAAILAPSDPNWPHYQAIARFERGELELAAKFFRQSAAASPADSWRWLHLGSVLLELGQKDEAQQALQRALQIEPESAAAHERLGRLAAEQGQAQEAARRFSRALELQPEANAIHYPLGQALLGLGQQQAAQHHLEQRGNRQVRWSDPLLEELGALIHHTVFEVLTAQAAEPMDKFDAEATIGFALDHLSGVDQVSNKIDAWLGQQQDLSDIFQARMRLVLGALHAAKGHDDAALLQLRQAVELQPGLTTARLRLARALVRADRTEEAFGHYTWILDSTPLHRQARLQRATLWVWAGRYEDALVDLEQAERGQKDDPEIIVRLAVTRRLAGDRPGYSRERSRLEALPLDPTTRTSWYQALASSLEASGWLQDATEVRHSSSLPSKENS